MDNNFGNGQRGNIPPNNNQNNGNKPDGNKRRQNIIILLVAAVFTIIAVTTLTSLYAGATTKEIPYNEFLQMVENGEVKSVVIDTSGKIIITPKDGVTEKETKSEFDIFSQFSGIKKTYYTNAISVDALYETLEKSGVEFRADSSDSSSTIIEVILSWIIPFVIIYFFMGTLFKKMGGGAMSVGKSKAKMYMQKDTGVSFADVAGQDEAKESLTEIVDFLHNPEKYSSIGAKLPRVHCW